jgi:hypothetical protein
MSRSRKAGRPDVGWLVCGLSHDLSNTIIVVCPQALMYKQETLCTCIHMYIHLYIHTSNRFLITPRAAMARNSTDKGGRRERFRSAWSWTFRVSLFIALGLAKLAQNPARELGGGSINEAYQPSPSIHRSCNRLSSISLYRDLSSRPFSRK